MESWIDYYNKKASESDNYLDVSDMHVGDDVANKNFLDDEKVRLMELLQPNPDNILVDLGCSAGTCLGLVHSAYKRSIGVDLSEGVLNIAKKRLPQCEFIWDDITVGSQIPESVADHILSYGVLQFLTNNQLKGLFEVIFKTLKPGGKAVIIRTPNKNFYEEYQNYRVNRNSTRKALTNENLTWNWVSPNYIKELCKDKFELSVILPTTGVNFPLKGFFDFILIKK